MQAPTRRQREVLDLIVRYINSHGYRPSYAVIARQLGLRSRAGIARIVGDLESLGLLSRRRENGHFFLDPAAAAAKELPADLVRIEWLEAPENGEVGTSWERSALLLPEFMIGNLRQEQLRAFRITDNEMSGEGAFEDDVVLVELRQFVRDGDRIVAVLDRDQAVLRKYYRSGSQIELRPSPSDPNAGPDSIIRMQADRVEIAGIYRGLIRPICY